VIWGALFSIRGMYTSYRKTDTPAYIYNSNQKIKHLSRHSFVNDKNEIWFRKTDMSERLIDFPKTEGNEYFSPLVRKKKVELEMQYFKLLNFSL